MAEFVRAQIFGTTFEITSRSEQFPKLTSGHSIDLEADIRIFNRLEWEHSVWFGEQHDSFKFPGLIFAFV